MVSGMLFIVPFVLKTSMPSSFMASRELPEAMRMRPVLRAVAPSEAEMLLSPKTPVRVAKSAKFQPTVLAVAPATDIASKSPVTSVLACACAFAIMSV